MPSRVPQSPEDVPPFGLFATCALKCGKQWLSRQHLGNSFGALHRTGVRSWWTVADPADLAGFDFADRLASAKWVSPHGGFASTGHSPEGRTLQ